jgi:hypothetical protein
MGECYLPPPSTALMLLSCLVLDGWASAAPKGTIDATFTATTTNVMMAINCGKITFRHRKIISGNQLDLINITIHELTWEIWTNV